ncbi:MAG: S8 family peptidase [Anaerolineae bacterium]|nr:S8 family peptidase [Anaerolineae bacterium]
MKKTLAYAAILLCLIVIFFPLSLKGGSTSQANADAPFIINDADIDSPPLDQLIIKFVNEAAANRLLAGNAENNGELTELSAAAGMAVTYAQPMALGMHVVRLPERISYLEIVAVAAALSDVHGVEFAEPNRIFTHTGEGAPMLVAPDLIPNDPQWSNMWHLHYTAGSSEGINAAAGWDITTGLASTVVAVIDTGILPHNDLAGKTVPGYDFITDPFTANDGDGRDPNPADPGDWHTAGQCGAVPPRNSSWHGTHVAGTIGAATNNSLGIAGVNWHAKILPARVLGRCGGSLVDIIDAMVWSAGIPVTGVPNNSNPAKVLNLSLGGSGSCSTATQNAVNAIVAAGSTVVVAAGNSNANASGFTPANCNNVITVSATSRTGSRSYYSNYGAVVEISGPGGETNVISSNGVLSTLDTGTTTPNNSHTYAYYQGTSMAAPHVAGVASLVLALRPAFTPAQVANQLQTTARPFPGGSSCNTTICGTGIVDVFRALQPLVPPPVTPNSYNYLPVVQRPLPTPTPSATPTSPAPTNPFVNPGFESGSTGWSQYSSHGWPIIVSSGPVPAHGGSWYGWLGGEYDDVSYVQQQVTVPASAPYLYYWHWIGSQDVCGYDFAYVRVNGTTVNTYNLCSSANTGGWVKKVINLSAYANQSVVIQVRAETDSSLNSNLFIDSFGFQASASFNEAGPATPIDADEAARPRHAAAP